MLSSSIQVVASLRKNRRLVGDFVRRDLRSRYAGASLGLLWSLLFPLINMAVYMFVFQLILKARWGDMMTAPEVTLIMLTGIVVWMSFAETLHRATGSMMENTNLIQKVVFPAEVLPTFLSISSLVNMVFGLPIVLVGMVVIAYFWPNYEFMRVEALAAAPEKAKEAVDVAMAAAAELGLDAAGTQAMVAAAEQRGAVGPALGLGPGLLALPLLFALQLIFSLGLSMFLATFNVLIRDIQHVIGVVTTVWMFATPIFYPAAKVQQEGFGFLLFNPMYWLIDSYRTVVLYGAWPDWILMLQMALVAFGVFAIGAHVLMKYKPRFPDLL